jgi:hypothetical protein
MPSPGTWDLTWDIKGQPGETHLKVPLRVVGDEPTFKGAAAWAALAGVVLIAGAALGGFFLWRRLNKAVSSRLLAGPHVREGCKALPLLLASMKFPRTTYAAARFSLLLTARHGLRKECFPSAAPVVAA